ncbi:Ras- protein Rab-11A [Schistosoma haematobium]|uniref:Ras- protein Rab-11A n=2 Tax=Schistosoma TaxID=6181 RepID=A0A922II89_SCHHA|nr:Ras- protein Rab-11A [Schistosoma haematobium]KAH9579615.1 Ras- protein Rab-11A [Schistosoma haematobium]
MRKHSHVYDSQNSKEFQHSVSVNSSKSDSFAPIFHECFSSVEQLSGPVSKLNEIIQDLIDYKNDAEFAAMTASDLAKRLHSNISADEAFQVVSYIHKFARYQAARCGLVNCSELVRAIIHILQTTKNVDLQSEAALTLQLLTKALTGAKLACEEIGIPQLVEMLRHPSEVMYTTALYVLNQLLWHLPNYSRPEFRHCNGQLNLIYLLEANRLDDSNWLLICLDTLRMAVYESSETKLSITSTNIYQIIVHLLRTYPTNMKIAYNIARLIKVLSVCNENKLKLVEAGTVEALTPLLNCTNEILQLETLWGLRNISDQAYHLLATKNLIPILINLLASKNEHISICSAGCLCNLTCQNVQNKSLLVEKGGVKVLCRLLCLNSDRQEIAEPICSALRHVTHRNPHSNSAIYEVRTSDTLSTIASLFLKYQFVSALPLLKSVVGLIRNLSTVEVTRHELKDLNVPGMVANIFLQTFNSLNKTNRQQYHGITGEESNNYLEGVNLEDMLELTLAALQIMAKDQSIQEEFIHTAGLVSSVVQLVYSPSVCLQRASTAFLSQLSTSRSGCQAIENEGACPRFTELIQSNNEYIAAYTAAILHRIAQDKPEAYRRRLSLELRQSLFDGGLLNDPNEIDPYKSSPSKLIDGISPNDNSPHITDRRSRNLSDSSLRQRSK